MSNFNRTVLEGYLEFASETGTIWKLCVSTFKLHDLVCSSGKISGSKSKKTEQFKYLNKISSSEKFTRFRLRCRPYAVPGTSWTTSRCLLFHGVPGHDPVPVGLHYHQNSSFCSEILFRIQGCVSKYCISGLCPLSTWGGGPRLVGTFVRSGIGFETKNLRNTYCATQMFRHWNCLPGLDQR